MSAGHKHSAILTDDGLAWTYGGGNCCALGHGLDFTDKHWPTLVNDLCDEYIVDIQFPTCDGHRLNQESLSEYL